MKCYSKHLCQFKITEPANLVRRLVPNVSEKVRIRFFIFVYFFPEVFFFFTLQCFIFLELSYSQNVKIIGIKRSAGQVKAQTRR